MNARDAWLAVLAAGVLMQALRWLPVALLRWRQDELPAPVTRALECAGVATIGGLLSLAVFRIAPAGVAPPALEAAGKLVALGLAFGLYLGLRRGTLCLVLAYGAYVLFTLTMR